MALTQRRTFTGKSSWLEFSFFFYIGIETQGRSHGCTGAKCSPSDNEGNVAVYRHTHDCTAVLQGAVTDMMQFLASNLNNHNYMSNPDP